jgi:hypothetical protein
MQCIKKGYLADIGERDMTTCPSVHCAHQVAVACGNGSESGSGSGSGGCTWPDDSIQMLHAAAALLMVWRLGQPMMRAAAPLPARANR